MENDWLNAEIGDEMPITAAVRQTFKELRDSYGKQSITEIEFRTVALANAVHALERRVVALEQRGC